jgi:hypothetical protein
LPCLAQKSRNFSTSAKVKLHVFLHYNLYFGTRPARGINTHLFIHSIAIASLSFSLIVLQNRSYIWCRWRCPTTDHQGCHRPSILYRYSYLLLDISLL